MNDNDGTSANAPAATRASAASAKGEELRKRLIQIRNRKQELEPYRDYPGNEEYLLSRIQGLLSPELETLEKKRSDLEEETSERDELRKQAYSYEVARLKQLLQGRGTTEEMVEYLDMLEKKYDKKTIDLERAEETDVELCKLKKLRSMQTKLELLAGGNSAKKRLYLFDRLELLREKQRNLRICPQRDQDQQEVLIARYQRKIVMIEMLLAEETDGVLQEYLLPRKAVMRSRYIAVLDTRILRMSRAATLAADEQSND